MGPLYKISLAIAALMAMPLVVCRPTHGILARLSQAIDLF
jgi:hypothetical protein